MHQMPMYFINLDARSDRRQVMEQRLSTLGLRAERISALSPKDLSKSDLDHFCDARHHFWLTPVELACSMSHVAALQAFLKTGTPYATIFEDDVVLSAALPSFLRAFEAEVPKVDLVKLETFDEPLLVGAAASGQFDHVALRSVYSQANGAAGYIVSREAAAVIVDSIDIRTTQADCALFNPHMPLAKRLIVRHTDPGLCIQQHRLVGTELDSADSQLRPSRAERRVVARQYRLRRDLRRLSEFLARTFWQRPNEMFWRFRAKAELRHIPFKN